MKKLLLISVLILSGISIHADPTRMSSELECSKACGSGGYDWVNNAMCNCRTDGKVRVGF